MGYKAFSTFEVKSFDEESREFWGIASTPTADRMKDIVEPLGARFKLPIPLLSKHDSSRPIGTVVEAKVSKAGIEYKAVIPKVSEPGVFKDRVDEAWHEIKYGVVRGVSIGFRPDGDQIEQLSTGGLRFKKWEWHELSTVPIPANVEATISRIKSIATGEDGASADGLPEVVRKTSPGVSGISISRNQGKIMKKSISEQVQDLQNMVAEKSARMEEVMQKSLDEGRSSDAAESEEFDTLQSEVARLNEDLKRLKALEQMQIKTAAPVEAKTQVQADRSRAPHIEVKSRVPTKVLFGRYVKSLAMAKGNRYEAFQIASERYADTPEIGMLLKGTVGTTTDADWAAPLVPLRNMQNDFIELLRNASIMSRIPGLRQVPFNVSMPLQLTGSTPAWVGQGSPKPTSDLSFGTVTLAINKVAGIVVITEELAMTSDPSAEGLIADDLVMQIGQFLDDAFINPAYAASGTVSPASITNGVTPIAATADPQADLLALVQAWVAANKSMAGTVFVTDSATAAALSMVQNAFGQPQYNGIMLGGDSGTLLGRPLIVSDSVPTATAGGMLVLMKPSEILVADNGGVRVDISREASVQMATPPNDPPTASSVFRSLWQENLVGIRAERFITWKKARPTSAMFLSGTDYSAAVSL